MTGSLVGEPVALAWGTGSVRPRFDMSVHDAVNRARGPGALRRVATISVHTSPLDQPGTGDAGGLNVYVVEVARQLARRGVEVEIFTRAVCRDTPPVVELAPGVLVRSMVA